MERSGIVFGPHSPEKRASARAMRRHMTPAEAALWQRIRGNRLDGLHFRRQQVIDGYIADFYCHAVGLVVEVDGPIHLSQTEYDEERTRAFRQRGLRILRFTNERILLGIEELLAGIRQEARQPAASGRAGRREEQEGGEGR